MSSSAAETTTKEPQEDGARVSTSKNPLLLLSYTLLIGLWILTQNVLVPYVVHLLLLVTSLIYVGCHWSLILREEQAISRGDIVLTDENDAAIPPPPMETMRKEDAMQFPLIGSAALFSLYMAFKFLNKDYVKLLISFYFCAVGCLALTVTCAPGLETIMGKMGKKRFHFDKKISHPLPSFIFGESPWDLEVDISLGEVLSFFASVLFCGLYFQKRHWTYNNVLGMSFCLQGIERFSLGTYKIGAILLVGLFFYDIFWVFGTEVMVTVAKNLDGPIKILFPRSLTPDPITNKINLSLLGLGDIVIPGFFLALLLRFDANNAKVPVYPTDFHAKFPKPYFHSCLIAYILGLGTTLYVMIVFEAAQPALLYLVPACLGSSMLCAVMRGEVALLFAYSEEAEEKEDEGEGEKFEDTSKDEVSKEMKKDK